MVRTLLNVVETVGGMSTGVDQRIQCRHRMVEAVGKMSTGVDEYLHAMYPCRNYRRNVYCGQILSGRRLDVRVETVSGISTGVDCCCNCNGDGVEIVSKMSTEVDQLN